MAMSYLHSAISKHVTKNEALFNLAAMLGHSSNVTTTWGVDTTRSALTASKNRTDNLIHHLSSGENALQSHMLQKF